MDNKNPKVSVIIPCYNQGQYIEEAVESVLDQTYQDFEIVIVNDGSTDEFTNNLLNNYNKPKTRVIHTDNQGLASARNNGIKEAKGEYILPLDADDKIGKEYLEEAVKILEANPGIGIVYCKAESFGAVDEKWELPEYSLEEMLIDNIIFCSAFFRKEDWEKVGGYDPEMLFGWEDYDFWLSLIEMEVLVYRIPKVLFYYRVLAGSMVKSKKKEQKVEMFVKIFNRHRDLFIKNITIWIDRIIDNTQYYTAQLYIDTGLGFNESQSLPQVITGSERKVEFDLHQYSDIKMLRFDPVNDYSILHINRILIVGEGNSSYEVEDYLSNAIRQEGNNLIFTNNDPKIWFNVPENKIQKIVINLNYIAIGKQAFDYLLKHKNELIIEKDAHINNIESVLKHKNELIIEKDTHINNIEFELNLIKQSKVWRTAEFFRRIFYHKIAPRRNMP